ncbi:triacylglycerol lipase [Desulfovibrionales bacterium]
MSTIKIKNIFMHLIALFLWLLVIIAMAVSLVTYLLFYYENANAATVDNPPAHVPSIGEIVRLLAMNIASQLVTYCLYPVGLARGFWFPSVGKFASRSGQMPSILLVHGLYYNAAAWMFLRQRLRLSGFARVFAASYNSFGPNFAVLVDEIAGQVEELCRRFPGERVVLIGHNLGGLIVRAALSRPGLRSHIAAVITLGAPHQGSKLARLSIGRLARSLDFRGPIIRSLEDHEQPAIIPALSLYSPTDNFILPSTGSRLLNVRAIGWVEESTIPVSHVTMLYHPAVASQVLRFLAHLRKN